MKTSKKRKTIKHIQDSYLLSKYLDIYFDLLKNKIKPEEKIMITVSGGPDSMLVSCLIYAFFTKNAYDTQNLFFIHCNHGTRVGNKKDEEFIKQFFNGTQLIIVKKPPSKQQTEADLRKRRYKEFKKQAKKYNINTIILGHNLTDRIESTFLNLLRGANINGLLSMQEQEEHHLLPGIQVRRPLLQFTKNEILQICKKNQIPFITDPTNKKDSVSLRNTLRNKILPKLYKLAHKQNTITNSFIESMKNIYTSLEKTYEEKNTTGILGTLNSIQKSPYRKAKFAYQWDINPNNITTDIMITIMKKLHIANNITTPLLNELTQFLKYNKSGYKYVNKTYFFKSHGNIYIISAPKRFREKTIDSEKKINTTIVQRFPRSGDRYKGKTRKQRCINQKIPIFRRNFIPVIAKKNQIEKILITTLQKITNQKLKYTS